MERTASAHWQGNLKEGVGKISTESGTLSDSPYSFGTRFGNQEGTTPEELIAAAYAGCFTMALSAELSRLGFAPESIQSHATVNLEKTQSDWNIPEINLRVSAQVPKISEFQFIQVAEAAKSGCPVSKLMKSKITLDAKLVAEEKGRAAS